VLRLALYEMLHDDQIPPKVAIAEAIRLSRKFSTPESSSFINAILDAIYKSSQGEQANVKQMSASVEALIKSEELANKAALEEKKREPKNEES
jgi:transcription antitermination protein NusB